MVTPEQLREEAVEADAIAGKLEKAAAAHRRQAERCRKLATEIEADPALSSITESRSMFRSKMELENEQVSKRVKISSKMTSDSPAKKALLEANITPKDVAALLGVGHSTVNAWCTGARSIPRSHVDRLREKHRIPAKVWPKIAG